MLDVAAQVRNWGRWGDDDQIGTLNYLTDGVVKAAASCIRSGRRFSLAYPLQMHGLQTGAIPGRINPLRTMVAINACFTGDPTQFCTSDDIVVMGLQAATHWDGLAHASYGGVIYGGRDAASITEAGASDCGVERIRSLTGRGVLLDVARLHGVDVLEPGHAITGDELTACAAAQGVEMRSGDIVLVRTGRMALARAGDLEGYLGPMDPASQLPRAPGIGLTCAVWFHEHEAAAVAIDTITFEVMPWDPAVPGAVLPMHCVHLVDMGLTQGQNFDLEELAADCAADGQWDFLLEASPQPFVGGLGSPVNPVAIK
ncbi:MAG: cyclase family protein [Actinobacteria bacterium]|nr:MAG: cyclase family protein [Actinomycetota bacterium]